MSIMKIVCSPADVGVAGYEFSETATALFDEKRVSGVFRFGGGAALSIPHDIPVGDEMWYHYRHSQSSNNNINGSVDFLTIRDANGNVLGGVTSDNGRLRSRAVGATTVQSGTQTVAINTQYSIDCHVTVNANITVRYYINGALYGESVASNSVNRGKPASAAFLGNGNITYNMAEMIIADEDTRGMRVREMRPKAFGIFQEWDGSIVSLRDTDLATGISTATPNRRVSFGVSNIEFIQPGDVINRVVSQTFAQKGETGLSGFNHFFRFRNAAVADGANLPLSVLGGYFLEEFPVNPSTNQPWQPDDFRSLQTGIQSRA